MNVCICVGGASMRRAFSIVLRCATVPLNGAVYAAMNNDEIIKTKKRQEFVHQSIFTAVLRDIYFPYDMDWKRFQFRIIYKKAFMLN